MRRVPRLLLLLAVGAVALLVSAAGAAANHGTRPHTDNMQALGHSPDFGSFLLPDGQRDVNSDLAFWRNLTFHGDYDGFRILRNRGGNDPQLISRTRCNGDQGDIVVWRDVLVRAWNGPRPERNCDGTTVPAGFEGMHIFDISNRRDPVLVGEVELSARPQADSPGCGTHTLTLVPDRRNDRVIIYNATSGGNQLLPDPQDRECDWIDIVEVPLDDPGDASHIRREPLMGGHAAHDNGVILGDTNKLAVASGHMSEVFDIGRNDTPGGSLEDPVSLFTIEEPGVCNTGDPVLCNGNWHSAAFTWDGEVVIMGWEPGGGSLPECEATDPPVKKSAFFYDADGPADDGTLAGTKLGQWTLPNPQSSAENCTIHNYNTVPLRDGRYVLVGGHYQAGTWVVDFTNPAVPQTLGWSDPPPAVPTQLGGAWSSYWYNGLIYESEIQVGLNIFEFTGRETRGAIRLPHLNPQTQEFSLDDRRGDDDDDDDDDDDRDDDDDDDDDRDDDDRGDDDDDDDDD
jgi:hypothetical protein